MKVFKKEDFEYEIKISPLISREETRIILNFIQNREISDDDIDTLVEWKIERQKVINEQIKKLSKNAKNEMKGKQMFVDDPNQPYCFISSSLKIKPTKENVESITEHFKKVLNALDEKFYVINADIKFDQTYPTLYCLIFHYNKKEKRLGFVDKNGEEFEIALESLDFFWVYNNVFCKI